LSRYVSPPRVRLRSVLTGRVRGDVRAIRPAGRIRAIESTAPERLEEAARQPHRSACAHRGRLSRPRTIPAHRERPPVARTADAAGNAEGRRPRERSARTGSLRREKPRNSPRADREGGKGGTDGNGGRIKTSYARSPKTSASNLHIVAPCFQASRGRPA